MYKNSYTRGNKMLLQLHSFGSIDALNAKYNKYLKLEEWLYTTMEARIKEREQSNGQPDKGLIDHELWQLSQSYLYYLKHNKEKDSALESSYLENTLAQEVLSMLSRYLELETLHEEQRLNNVLRTEQEYEDEERNEGAISNVLYLLQEIELQRVQRYLTLDKELKSFLLYVVGTTYYAESLKQAKQECCMKDPLDVEHEEVCTYAELFYNNLLDSEKVHYPEDFDIVYKIMNQVYMAL